ncbi:protein of unknown function [Cupriavidus taiwanensis]|uniref:Uncharacterized protein n=1 Tax=Cupriavidus taiwanensis TaxID=164546 RepID=A0A375IGF0_9BURK|nr:hypothetical protein CBM2588_A40080 [Cupriavidus taiwanensis]SOY54932.1 hypothetical protein CBM2592_A60049 [Cupriavidus taiwanensis]SOY88022.1 hypothetical protein CBM2591_A50048 [Cupriavidus taiwanensis]SOZ24714.1 hypothetical protein CBM2608_A50058 [Cupriavidus taiwanensis]SOZ61297.1 hypothetical protein CBM2617_A40050 [Cupriavidus taiwanensis]
MRRTYIAIEAVSSTCRTLPVSVRPFESAASPRFFFAPAVARGRGLFISRRPSPYGYPLCQALHILIKGVPAPGWPFLYNRGERLRRSIGWIWSRISSPR